MGFSRSTPIVASLDNGLTPAVTLSDPFPASIYPAGLLQPIGNSQGLASARLNAAYYFLARFFAPSNHDNTRSRPRQGTRHLASQYTAPPGYNRGLSSNLK